MSLRHFQHDLEDDPQETHEERNLYAQRCDVLGKTSCLFDYPGHPVSLEEGKVGVGLC